MKKLLLMAVAVSLCASSAWAGYHYPIKDSGISNASGGWGTEEYANSGAATQVRFMKGRENYLLLDFDWAAIGADLAGIPGAFVDFRMVAADSGANHRWCSHHIS